MNYFRFHPSLSRILYCVALLLALGGCGFKLRGLTDLSFDSLYMEQGGSTAMTGELQRLLTSNGVKLKSSQEDAELLLELMRESSQKRILSLSGSGKVREYELVYRVEFRTRRAEDELWGEPQFVEGRRDFTYDDTLLLAKESEESRLYADMRTATAREIMRRLSALKSPSDAHRP